MRRLWVLGLMSVCLASCTVTVPDASVGVYACNTDDDCDGDYTCKGSPRRCMKPGDVPDGGEFVETCQVHTDCHQSPMLLCSSGNCIDPCGSVANCPGGCIADASEMQRYRCTDSNCQDGGCGQGQECVETSGTTECVPNCEDQACVDGPGVCVMNLAGFDSQGNTVWDRAACIECDQMCADDMRCTLDQGQSNGTYDGTIVECMKDMCGGCMSDQACVWDDMGTVECLTSGNACTLQEAEAQVDGPRGVESACFACAGCAGGVECVSTRGPGHVFANTTEARNSVGSVVAAGWYTIGGSGCGRGASDDGIGGVVQGRFDADARIALAMTKTDPVTVFVAYVMTPPGSGIQEIRVRQWDSVAGWQGVPPGSSSQRLSNGWDGNDAAQPVLKIASPFLYAGWVQSNDANEQVYLARIKLDGGGVWEDPDGGAIGGGGVTSLPVGADIPSMPAIAPDPGGTSNHLAVWRQTGASVGVYFSEYAGGWTANQLAPTANPTRPSLVRVLGNVPVLAWEDMSGTAWVIKVRWYVVGTWQSGPNWSTHDNLDNDLTTDDHYPFIAAGPTTVAVVWRSDGPTESSVHISHLNDFVTGDWRGYWISGDPSGRVSEYGGVGADDGAPALAIDGQDYPYVAWAEGNQIMLRRFAGQWDPVGDSMNWVNGLSLSPMGASRPAVAIGNSPNGTGGSAVCVAWIEGEAEGDTSPDQVYLRCFDI